MGLFRVGDAEINPTFSSQREMAISCGRLESYTVGGAVMDILSKKKKGKSVQDLQIGG